MITKKKTTNLMSETVQVMAGVFKFRINGTYRRIWQVAEACGVDMPKGRRPGAGFCFLNADPQKAVSALCCIHLSPNKYWLNTMSDDGNVITEKKISDKTPVAFQKRLRKGRDYDVDITRICFVEEHGVYRFAGFFRLAQVDFNTQTAIFHRVPLDQLQIKVTTRRKVTVVVEEETTVVVG